MTPEIHTLASSSGGYSHKVWHLPAKIPARKIAIFLDGEHYVRHMDAPARIGDFIDRNQIAPMACLSPSKQELPEALRWLLGPDGSAG